MTKDAVQQVLRREPFQPFSFRLTDGKLIPVPHPEFLSISPGGRTAIVFHGEEQFSIVDLGLVTAIEFQANGH
ncbi:MAG: hypothetical protein KGJ60_01280 [Verrucomicrobiota bacterium]|nr:hypothetical protein [Verrucomicrobiota bacterium]